MPTCHGTKCFEMLDRNADLCLRHVCCLQIRDGSGWVRWDLANWAPAPHQGFGGKKAGQDEDEDDEEEEEEEDEVAGAEEKKDSAIEVMRDRSVISFIFLPLPKIVRLEFVRSKQLGRRSTRNAY